MSATNDQHAADLERMERERKQKNAEVRDRPYCKECRRAVPDRDYNHKFAAAGGFLAGPFCSRECYYNFLLEDDYSAAELRDMHRDTTD